MLTQYKNCRIKITLIKVISRSFLCLIFLYFFQINENGGFILINISHDSISSFHGTNRNEVKSRGSSAHTVGYFFIEIPVKNSVTSSSYNNNNYEYTTPLLPTTREKFIGKTTNFIAMETVTSQPKTLKVNSWKDEISAITQTSK